MKRFLRHFPFLACASLLGLAGAGWAEPAISSHSSLSCGSCHRAGARLTAASPSLAARKCRDCHGATIAAGKNHHLTGQERCLECHSFHEPTIVKTTVGAVDLAVAGDQDQGHCRSCHNEQGRLADLSGAHQTAANLYHEEAGELQNVSPSAACLRCHSQASVSPWQAATAGQTLTFNTHASHPYSVKVVPGQGDKNNWIAYQIDARLPLFAGKMECQTCHLLTAGQKDLLIPFETKYDLCRGCHKHTGDSKLEARPVLTSLSNR